MQRHSRILLIFCLMTGCLSAPPPLFVEYQDSLGQYKFGYSAPGSARSEIRSVDGVTRGSYSYMDDSGMIQSAEYTADGERGFQIVATNLPQAPKPVEETPEVVAARLNHLKAIEEASTLTQKIPEINVQPVIAVSDGKSTDSVVIENTSNEKAKSESEGNGSVTKVTARIGIAEAPAGLEENSGQPGRVEFAVPIPVLPQAAAFIVPISHGEARVSHPIPDIRQELNFRPVTNGSVIKPTLHNPKSIAVQEEADQSSIAQVADPGVLNVHREASASHPILSVPEGNFRFKTNTSDTKTPFRNPKSLAIQEEAGQSSIPQVADSDVPNVNEEARASQPIPSITPELNFRPETNGSNIKPTFHHSQSIAIQQEAEGLPMPQQQAASIDPSVITPAGTRLSPNAGSETSGMIGESLPISGASEEAATSSGRAHVYSAPLAPNVQIVPSTTYQHVTYGIGVNPFYNVYNPYNPIPVFRYGIF